MKRFCKPIARGALVLALIASAAVFSQAYMEFIDNSVFRNPKMSPAPFAHDEHNEMAGLELCGTCHHVYDEDGRLVEDESSEDYYCSDCHGERAEGRAPGLRQAFHLSCRGCHMESKAGPILCGECHINKIFRAGDHGENHTDH